MNIKTSKIYFILFIILITSCNSKGEVNTGENNSLSTEQNIDEDEINVIEEHKGDDSFSEDSDSACKYEDGTYSATVDYNNSETGYSATYSLDVEVQDCQIVQINFPNDGYLDDDHISYADIEDDGSASVTGEDGKTYEIQIDN
jgi:hypothetical protein